MRLTKNEKRLLNDFIKFLKEIKVEVYKDDDIKTIKDYVEFTFEEYDYFYINLQQFPDVVSIFKKYGINFNDDLKYKSAICFSKEYDRNDKYGLCLDFQLKFNNFSDSKIFEQIISARYNCLKETMLLNFLHVNRPYDYIPSKENFNYSFDEMMEQYHNMLNFIEWSCKLVSNDSVLVEMRKQYQDLSKEIAKLTNARKAFVSKNAAILYELADIERA